MEEFIAKLVSLGLDEAKAKDVAEKAGADGVTDLASAQHLTEGDLTGYGVGKIKARQIVAALQPVVAPVAPAAILPATVEAAAPAASLLPPIPQDSDFLKLLQIGGVLKPKSEDVIAAVRGFDADRFGFFGIEKTLFSLIEQHAYDNDAEFPACYMKLRRSMRRKAHAEVLEALDVPAAIVSEKNVNQFLERLNRIWPALSTFQKRIIAWDESRMSKLGGNVNNLVAALSGQARRIASPDTMPVVTAAEEVINVINKAFAGAGIYCARSLAADAMQINSVLEDAEIMQAVGATSHEDLLRNKLKLSVGTDARRHQLALTQYVLSVLELPTKPVTQLPDYIIELREIGDTLDFENLSARTATNGAGGGGAKRNRNEYGKSSGEPHETF